MRQSFSRGAERDVLRKAIACGFDTALKAETCLQLWLQLLSSTGKMRTALCQVTGDVIIITLEVRKRGPEVGQCLSCACTDPQTLNTPILVPSGRVVSAVSETNIETQEAENNERETETEIGRQRETETERDRDRDTQRERDRERDRGAEKETERETHTHTHRDRQRQRDIEIDL